MLSVLRGFSAPVKVEYERPRDELAYLVRHDTDGFSRWDAMQSLHAQEIERLRCGGAEPALALLPLYRRIDRGSRMRGGSDAERMGMFARCSRCLARVISAN